MTSEVRKGSLWVYKYSEDPSYLVVLGETVDPSIPKESSGEYWDVLIGESIVRFMWYENIPLLFFKVSDKEWKVPP